MMSSQEQIVQAIQNYLESDRPNAALLINGEWGSGKTYFWKKTIVPILDAQSRNTVYVSLYGISSHAEIEQQVLYAIYPFLDSKIARVGRFIGEVRGYRIPPIKYVPKLKRAVFCFDDLERSSLNASDVLGYINRFIEQYESHVLILANELQIADEKYSTVKEKVVGKTFAMKPNIDLALSNIWSSLKGKAKLLDDHRQVIQNTIKGTDQINLRSAIQAVDNCNLVLHRLETLPNLKADAVNSVMVMVSALTMESKISPELMKHLRVLIVNPQAFLYSSYSKRDSGDGNRAIELIEGFAARYFEGSLDRIPSLGSLLDFIESGWIDIDLVCDEVMAIESPEHTEELDPRKLFLRNIWSLQDQQIHEVAQSYIRDVHTELITKADVLARAFAALVFISKHQIIAQSSETLLQIFLKVVDKFTLENRFTAEDIGGWDANSIFYSPLEPEVEELLAALTNARDQFLERQQERRVHSLFREFDTEYNTFLQRMGGKFDDDHFDYLHTPILARFDAQAFAEAIGRKSALDIRHFSELLNQRYLRVVNIADFLQEESAILIEMASQLRGKLLCMSPCMKRIAIEGVVGQLEQASIKLNPPNTQSEIPPFVNGV